jgi:hypothetical protein
MRIFLAESRRIPWESPSAIVKTESWIFETGKIELPPGQAGELTVFGPNVFQG